MMHNLFDDAQTALGHGPESPNCQHGQHFSVIAQQPAFRWIKISDIWNINLTLTWLLAQ